MNKYSWQHLIETHLILLGGIIFVIALVGLIHFTQIPGLNGSGQGPHEILIGLIFYFFLILLFLKLKGNEYSFVWKLILVVLCLRILLIFLNYSFSFFSPAQDALNNSQAALELASAWRNGEFGFNISENVEPAYVLLIAIIYFLFGYNLYIACVFNLIASILAIYYIYQLAIILYSKQDADLAIIIFAAMPYLNFMSFFLNREMLVIFLMIFMTYTLVLWLKETWFSHKFSFILALCYTALLRPENLAFMSLYFGFIFFLHLFNGKYSYRSFIAKYGLSVVLLIVAITLYFSISSDAQLQKAFHLKDLSPEAFYQKAQRHIHFGFAYLPEKTPDSWFEVTFLYGPQQTMNFLLRPFPWEIFRFNQLFLVINNLILYFLYLFSVIGLLRLSRREPIILYLAVLLFLFIGIFPASLVQGNAFAASRHREQLIFFIYILGAGGVMTLMKSSSRDAAK